MTVEDSYVQYRIVKLFKRHFSLLDIFVFFTFSHFHIFTSSWLVFGAAGAGSKSGSRQTTISRHTLHRRIQLLFLYSSHSYISNLYTVQHQIIAFASQERRRAVTVTDRRTDRPTASD